MAWTVPITWLSGTVLTAAQLNGQLRDNMLASEAGQTTTVNGDGSYFASTAINTIAERNAEHAEITTSETTTSLTYADLATVGPSVTVSHGTQVLVLWSAQHQNNTALKADAISINVSGANTAAADDSYAVERIVQSANYPAQHMHHIWFDSLIAGTSTFKLQYRVTGGTGTFSFRRIVALPF